MRRFLIVLGIALVAIGLGRGASTAHAATLTVCPHGCAYTRIQAAINAAAPGDTIQIRKGTYDESVEITKNVALVGAGARETTIRSSRIGIFVHEGVSTNINALRVTGGGPGIVNAGILIVVNVEISDSGHFAFRAGGIHNDGNLTLVNSTVHNNRAHERGGGIYNEDGARLTLQGSTVRDNRLSNPRGEGGGIYNDSERGDVRLEQGSRVTDNLPNNCVNVTGCGFPTVEFSSAPSRPR